MRVFQMPAQRKDALHKAVNDIEYVTECMVFAANCFHRRRKLGSEPMQRRLKYMLNTSLRELQWHFGWNDVGNKKSHSRSFIYASRGVYDDLVRQVNNKRRYWTGKTTRDHFHPINIDVASLVKSLISGETVTIEDFLKVIFGPVGLITRCQNRQLVRKSSPNHDKPLARYIGKGIKIIRTLEGEEVDVKTFSWADHFSYLQQIPELGRIYQTLVSR